MYIYADASISGVNSVATLKGFMVGVQEGDACVDKLAEYGIGNLVLYPNYEAVIKAAQNEQIKVFCLDEYPASFYLYKANAHHQFRKAFELYQGQVVARFAKETPSCCRSSNRGCNSSAAKKKTRLR